MTSSFCVYRVYTCAVCRILIAVALFRRIDVDNTGKLSKANLKNLIHEAGADVPDSKIDELIAKVDSTGTGEINFRDFIAALIEFVRSRQ